MSEVVWRPTRRRRARERDAAPAPAGRRRLRRARPAARRQDPEWFWPLCVEDLGLEFSTPWEQVLDDSRGPEWTTWFVGGTVSIARNCVHRWAERRPDAVAAVGLGEDGSRTHAHLRRALARRDAARRGARRARRRRRATASRSSCRCRRRSRSPRTRSRTSARSRCRSSPASPRRPSRSGSRRARRRS